MIHFINLTEFCGRIGLSQAGSISETTRKIAEKFGVEPVAVVEGKTESGEVFSRPLYTPEQAAMVCVLRGLMAQRDGAIKKVDALKAVQDSIKALDL